MRLVQPLYNETRQERATREIERRRERGHHFISEVAHTYGEALPVDESLERSGPYRYAVTDAPFSPFRRLLRWWKGID